MTALLRKLERWLTAFENTLAATSLLLILFLSLAEIVGRNVFHQGVPGADVAMRHLVLWVAFFGAVLAVADNRHVKVDVAAAWFPQRFSIWSARPFAAFAATVCGGLAVAGYKFWWEEWTTVPPDEKWVTILIGVLPLGFGLLMLHYLLHALIGPPITEQHS